MDVRVYIILLLVCTQCKWIHSVTISGSVSEQVNFIHKTFPVQPSTRAIIEVDVYYPVDEYYENKHSSYFPILGIYTTQDHVNIRSHCTDINYGQLLNFDLHPSITLDRYASRPLKCVNDNTTSIHCTGNITVQDFKPRNFSFSFGFKCGYRCGSCSLRGLIYKLRIHGQTNATKCVNLYSTKGCYYFRYSVLPHLFGDENVKGLPFQYQVRFGSTCYQYAIRFLCYLYFPQCDDIVQMQITYPCREMCHDYVNACGHLIRYKIDCDYLPPSNGDRYCYRRLTNCHEPPTVENAVVVVRNDTAHYSCSEGFTLEGCRNITCMLTGKWSRTPHCIPATPKQETSTSTSTSTSLPPLLYTAPSVLVLVILIIIITLICRIKLKAKRTQRVNRDQMQADIELTEVDELAPERVQKKRSSRSICCAFEKEPRV